MWAGERACFSHLIVFQLHKCNGIFCSNVFDEKSLKAHQIFMAKETTFFQKCKVKG